MSKGKYYSLEEARQENDLKGFAEEHPSTGNKQAFDNALSRMAKNSPLSPKKDKWGRPVDCSETQTQQDT
jgi:hypothetical protein